MSLKYTEEEGYALFLRGNTYRMEDGTYLVKSEENEDTYHFVTPEFTRFGMSCDCADYLFCHQGQTGHRCVHLWACFFAESASRNKSEQFLQEGAKPEIEALKEENTFVKKVSDLLLALRRGVAS